MFSKRVVISSLSWIVAVACAEAQDERPDSSGNQPSGKSGGGHSGTAGKSATAGTSGVSQGGSAGGTSAGASAGGSGNGGKAGAASGGAAHAGSSSGGSAGASGSGAGGKGGASGSAGAASGSEGGGVGGSAAGTSAGGSGSGLGCGVEPSGGAGGDTASGGADGNPSAFFDDFESGTASKWTTTLGTWAVVDDGSKAYDQSLQENKLQIAIANGTCFVDQVIDARVKVVGFKGQSNSYVAAVFGRVLSPTTHYLLALGSDGKLALRKRVNSTSTGATAIGTAAALTISEGTWYDVHFEIIGTSLKGCVGVVCVTGTDSSIAAGGVAVGTVNTSARFDDVRVMLP